MAPKSPEDQSEQQLHDDGQQQQASSSPSEPSKENRQLEAMDDERQELKTPEKVDKIPKDDSFKTCKTYMPSGKTKRQLRMTPARNSILSGGTPFKETTPASKKFNSRSKKMNKSGSKRMNDTADSNETFIRHEQELLFDRDSLDMAHHKLSSTPLILPELLPSPPQQRSRRRSIPKVFEVEEKGLANADAAAAAGSAEKPTKVVGPTQVLSPRKSSKPEKNAAPTSNAKKAPSPIKVNRNKPATRAPASNSQAKFRRPISPTKSTATKTFRKPWSPERFKRPLSPTRSKRPQIRPPSSVKSTTSSRYLSQWNNSRLTRAQSFKSTAELEREYFTSLRSRF